MQAMAINGTIQTIQGLIQVAMMQLVCTYICMYCMSVHAYVHPPHQRTVLALCVTALVWQGVYQ